MADSPLDFRKNKGRPIVINGVAHVLGSDKGAIDRAVPGGGGEPCAGITRDAVTPPSLEGQHEGVLRALLGEIPVAGHPDEGRDDTTPLRTERGDDRGLDLGRTGHICQIGLTSIDPARAPGIFDAISIASSRSLQSTM